MRGEIVAGKHLNLFALKNPLPKHTDFVILLPSYKVCMSTSLHEVCSISALKDFWEYNRDDRGKNLFPKHKVFVIILPNHKAQI